MPASRRALAWTAAIAVPVVAGAVILVPMAASGAVDLPDKSVEELIEFAGASDVEALSGTIEQTSELGLPDLGALTGSMGGQDDGSGDSASAADIDDLIALVTGSHTAKVYLDGEKARLQVLDRLAERNVYVDGEAGEVWFVDSESAAATRFVLPSEAELEQLKADAEEKAGEAEAGSAVPTPDEMLDQALAALDESTEVTVGTDARVAGRDVYELILEPRTDDTLVGELRFAIDGENGAALAASVTARGADEPAFEIAFSQVDFTAPDPAVFAFVPGADVTVTEKDVPLPTPGGNGDADAGERPMPDVAPVVTGEGWSTVVELPAGSEAGGDVFAGLEPEQLAMLESVTTAVDGGRVLQTSLLTVLITDDGRVLVGAVPASVLADAAR
jgi:hypothetical protein